MKKYIIIALSILAFSSCAYLQSDDDENHASFNRQCFFDTKSKETFLLSKEDIADYTRLVSLSRRSNRKSVIGIAPILMSGTTVFYVVNYNEGWQVLSSDKRGPTVLAESPNGSFDYERLSAEERSWFESIGHQILFRLNSPSKYYSEISDEGMENERLNNAIWEEILGRRSQIDHIQIDTIHYVSQDHLISVYWSQHTPFNEYCPLTTYDGTTRCPAGCVPLAGAQTLYYLHYYLGRPISAPSNGSCNGWYQNYTQSFSNYSSTWDYMYDSYDPYGYAALLIGAVGQMVNVTYSPSGSSAYTSDLVQSVFAQFGINCSYTTFNSSVAFDELQDGMPVICRANDITYPYGGHAFIIDGYESAYLRTRIFYDDGGFVNIYSNPFITRVRINWGWGTSGRTATYAIDGTWWGYDNGRAMVYGFCTENK